nr:hypothetical protein [Lysobacter sp.]
KADSLASGDDGAVPAQGAAQEATAPSADGSEAAPVVPDEVAESVPGTR